MKKLSNSLYPFILVILIAILCGCGNTNPIENVTPLIDIEKEKQAIMQVIKEETKAYYEKDIDDWKSMQVKKPYQVSMGYWEGFPNKIIYIHGWDSLYNQNKQTWFNKESESKWDDGTQEIENVNIRVYPDVAWVTFEASEFEAGTHEFLGKALGTRILEKENGEWKIAYVSYLYYPLENEEEVNN